jgi:subtilisin family serine protease
MSGIIAGAGAHGDRALGAGAHELNVGPGQAARAIAALKRDPRVRYAEPNYVVHATETIPNDPMFSQLWAMKNTGQAGGTPGADVKATFAWDTTTGDRAVVVGVVDTGIWYDHVDLAANVWSNPGGVGGCAAGTYGYNAILNTCDPKDDNRHGTHVSGTIGAVGNNATGVAGINWNTSLMGLKFLNALGSGTTANAIAAIDFAVKAKAAGVNVRVLNNSWGGGGFSQALLDEINLAGASDILFVVAAGNSASDNDVSPFYPCSYSTPNEICVASTDRNDNLSGFSNYGATSVDLGAPGSEILSTVLNNSYATLNGTSMATPHVTGTAALVLALGYLSVADLKLDLLSSVDPIPALSDITVSGGRLNTCMAVGGLVCS